MKLNKAISLRLKEIIKELGITQYELFKRTGVPQSTISTILKGDVSTVKLSTLYDICSGLNIEFVDFFSSPLFSIENITD